MFSKYLANANKTKNEWIVIKEAANNFDENCYFGFRFPRT